MTKRRRIHHADKIFQNLFISFCLLMFIQLRGYYAVLSNPMLLYSTALDIRFANISRAAKVTTITDGLEQGSAVDFLYRKQLICWSDQTAEVIQCMFYNGTYTGEKIKIVSEGLITPTGIAIDWYTDKIYWTDGETNKIEVIGIDTKYRKVLFWSDVDLARAIAVVPMKGLMFWTDWGETPKIERAGMNGDPETRKVIVKDNIFWPNGITIDYLTNLIYWVDAKLQFVDVIDFDGNNRRRIVNGGLEYPYALTLFNEKLYWTDWKTWAIHTWDITTSGPIKDLIKSDPVPVDIRVYDSRRQPMPQDSYPCSVNNGNCSHLCLLTPNSPGYSCACPTGIKLKENSNTTCHSSPQSFLIVAQRSGISRISLDSPDFTPETIRLKDVKRAITIDFDHKAEHIYWADNISKTISRARLDGSEQMTIIHSAAGALDSIAVDSLARNIYWTDPTLDTISVAKLDGSCRKVIIYEDLYEPRAIALHPTAGWMFWSDWNERKPKIERASLDGSDRVLIVYDNLAWPNGIALDTKTNKLYWGDAKTHKIEVCNMDGTDRRELHNNDILHIFGLTLLGDYLYWTDTQRRTLDRINKDTGAERQPVIEQMANMMGVKAFHLGDKLGWNPCVDNNGNCSHLCFNRPHDSVCACPLGLELGKDRKKCIEPEAFLLYACKNIIGRISIENDNNDAILPLKELKVVSALAVHVSESKLYWSDSWTKTINRCTVNGSYMERILDLAGLVEGLAVDWSGQNIYWTDTAAQRIEVARLDGFNRRALIWQGLKKPKSIALDPKKGYMYWSELGSKTIKRAGMDGSAPTVIQEQVSRANALTIDYEKRTLYWATLDPPAIEYSDLDGANRRKLITENVPMPYALTVYKDYVYWGDWSTGDVEAANKSQGAARLKIHTKLDYITDLKMYNKSRQSGGNQCAVDNGGCSHLCLATPILETGKSSSIADYRCACPTHYRLNPDNLTCSEPENFVLFAQKNSLGRIMVGADDCTDATIPLVGLKNIKSIEYDPVNRHIYWMNEESHSIRRVIISSSTTSALTDATTVVTGLSRPFHMVLDVLGRALYWSCFDSDSINVTSIDSNSSMGVIVQGKGMMPRHLALHQTKRLLVWTDVGSGSIMRAAVDGSSRRELARVANATALTIDQNTGVVYWAVSKQIHAIDIEGNNKRVVWQGGWVATLAAYSGALYWAGGGGDRLLMRVTLARRDAPAAPVPHALRIVAVISVYKVAREHPCYGGAACGGAAGACLAEGTCGCGAGCMRRPPACPPEHYTCAISRHPSSPDTHCVPRSWKCDGQIDCPDGSDEAECGPCDRGVRCVDGTCGESLVACDSGAVCGPGEMPDAFRCSDGHTCLASILLCDDRRHCHDGSDEAVCGEVRSKDLAATVQPGHSNALAIAGAILGVAVVTVTVWVALRRWKTSGAERRRDFDTEMSAARRLYPRKPTNGSFSTERVRPVGASGSDSGCERYPRETLNPPPSPATEGGVAAGSCGRRRAYRHYRAMNRPPPPTPCSTDACESDCAGAMGAAPPPTPCATSPPSPSAPSSRSSTYFSPFPPPPSPVPHLSDS